MVNGVTTFRSKTVFVEAIEDIYIITVLYPAVPCIDKPFVPFIYKLKATKHSMDFR